jgi:predicted polyphosphate/ATP-dependent NAD kinase
MQKQGKLKIGLLVNPIAGMGGKVGLHGTDDLLLQRAKDLGAKGISTQRTQRAIKSLLPHSARLSFYTSSKTMGADVLDFLKLPYELLHECDDSQTSAIDTQAAILAFMAERVDVILFAGGDGTARDIFSKVGANIPMLGIPSGVKMRSGVFANYPEEAAEIIIDALAALENGKEIAFSNTEILDLTDLNQDYSESHFFGSARTFSAPNRISSPKVNSNASSDVALQELAKYQAGALSKDRLYFFGPGRSAKMVLTELGTIDSNHSLAGVDALINGVLIGKDLDEKSILELIETYAGKSDPYIFLGVIGGQGFLLGRGNQQLSLEVMSRIGAKNTFVMASASKMNGTVPTRLYVDFNEAPATKVFADYIQVHVAKNRTLVCKVVSSGLATTAVRAS